MSGASTKVPWQDWAALGVIGVVVANAAAAKALGYPFLYCWFSGGLSVLYFNIAMLVLYIALAMTVFYLVQGNMFRALASILFIVAVIELPHVCVLVFRMGASCG